MLSVAFMLQDPGHTAYPRPFMWFLSNCIIWSEATGRLCPSAPTLLIEKSKYLAEVNRAEMRSLTFLQERSHNTSIKRMPDRAGRATLFHKFFYFFLHLLQWFVHPLFLASAIDQIMTCEASRMQGKGESNFKKSVWAWDEAILLG